MPRRLLTPGLFPARTRPRAWALAGLCAVLALTNPLPLPAPFAPRAAWAQDITRLNQALFLAVEKNDLPGVQAAINAGANVDARDYNGRQAVDLAIDRGFFDIAHYLISVRNALQAKGGTPEPAPSPEQLAEAQRQASQAAPADPFATPAQSTPAEAAQVPAPQIPAGAPNPFEAPVQPGGLPVVGEVREPPQMPASTPAPVAQTPPPPATPAAPVAAATAGTEVKKPSATKTFVTSFLDFFKPPNTTGIVAKPQEEETGPAGVVTDSEIAKELEQLQAEQTGTIKGPAVPISPEELARELPPAPELPEQLTAEGAPPPQDTPELPPYIMGSAPTPATATAPEMSGDQAFSGMEISEATPTDAQPQEAPATGEAAPEPAAQAPTALDSSLPFGGGVDPDVLALIGMAPAPATAEAEAPAPEQVAEADPFAPPAQADPFAAPAAPAEADPFAQAPAEGTGEIRGLLEGLPPPQDVKTLTAQKPPAPETGAEADPFAAPPPAPPGGVDELAGLLDGAGEKVAAKPDGWDVKEVEGAALPSEVPVLTEIEPTGQVLDGVELSLGADTVLGQQVGDERLQMMKEETIHKPCLTKDGPDTLFCVDKVNWPFEMEEDFLVDTIMYQGTRAVARYDAGRATNFHALFKTETFPQVVAYYIQRYGPPTKTVARAIAPLAQPRRDNPTYIWQSREPDTDTITTLEIRQFDDARGEFPDTRRGVLLLYRAHAGTIFPQLSQLELMVLKADGSSSSDTAPKTPESVW